MARSVFLLGLATTLLLGSAVFYLLNEQSYSAPKPDEQEQVLKQWKQFKLKYNKRFSDQDTEMYRMEIFSNNLQVIAQDKTGTLGITQFADISREEFAETYLTLNINPKRNQNTHSTNICKEDIKLSINWVNKGAVSAIKNQGRCGSCWAFSTTGAIESALIVAGKADNSIDLSEQQLVDCSKKNKGCSGGLMDRAFEYVERQGITTNENYPYTATDGECVKPTKDLVHITSHEDIPQSCTSNLKIALQNQPISVAVDASDWSLYTGGVLSDCGDSLNHGVLLVGYENDIWIIKNSWGTTWGENGYIQLKEGNTCGIADAASFPTI